jgi:putative transposase
VVWQRRSYPFGVYSEKKRLEKLIYLHNNPVKHGLVKSPGEWPWSSFRFYELTIPRSSGWTGWLDFRFAP